ncbi:MAG TPA: CHAT domain-containing protein [Blastocatellia bacterium]|nr:CHAT domain-containing protein [Blastocatellia bacterium]
MAEVDEKTIRQYLLGELDEAEMSRFEERLMTDDALFELLQVVEDDLIDEAAARELSAEEQSHFDQHFLATPDRRARLELSRGLQDYAARQAEARAESKKTTDPAVVDFPPPKPEPRRSFWSSRRVYLSLAAAVILIAIGLGTWRAFFYQSDVSKGLQALNQAYRNQRPTEARITGLNYAPQPPATRGSQDEKFDRAARNRAERILQDEAEAHPGAQSFHALGQLYLAEHRLDEAIEQFEKAVKLDDKNAQLHSDYGAALLEKGKAERSADDSGKSLEDFARSLEHLSKALEFDGSLLEALFNRAILYQYMGLPQQAEEDWKKYIQKDSGSRWADEARQNLRRLEEKKTAEFKPTNQLLSEFLNACRSQNDEIAFDLLSKNTEAITGKLIWWQLIGAYLDLSLQGDIAQASQYLQALAYVGALQGQKAGDRLVSDVTEVYKAAAPEQQSLLVRAHALVNQGHSLLAKSETEQALNLYSEAKDIFAQAGDPLESRFADYYVGYCFYRKSEFKRSLSLLSPVAEYGRARSYLWLRECALTMMANILGESDQFSSALAAYRESLEISRRINDEYNTQRNLTSLAYFFRYLGDRKEAFAYMQQCLDRTSRCMPGPRQMYRNLDTAAGILNAFGYFAAAAAYEEAALQLAIEASDPGFKHLSYMQLGAIYTKLQNYPEALKSAERCYEVARAMSDEHTNPRALAHSFLQLAHTYRQLEDYTKAIAYYDDAIKLYEEINLYAFLYEAHKGRLLCYMGQGDDPLAEAELQTVLAFFEEHRSKIREEKHRNSFFDLEQYIYDIAIDFEVSKKHDIQKAFEYSEMSRARSLLDLMSAGIEVTGKDGSDAAIRAVSQPIRVAGIREQMPDQVQLLQYAVLDDKLVVWLISKTQFVSVQEKIGLTDLTQKILDYWKSISNPGDAENSRRRAVELYDILVKPFEPLLEKEKQICVIPDKALNYLPFNALISSVTGQYLVKEYTISFAPSANTFLFCFEKARDRAAVKNERALCVGNPAFNREAFPGLAALPSSGKEAEEVARCYGSRCCLVGENARKAKIKEEMERANVLHLASHYVVDEHNPMLSKLLTAKAGEDSTDPVADSVLQADDIFHSRLPLTRLVVLSACRTGAEQYYKGEGMIGFSRTFLAAGVPLVVASLWPVDSDSTADLMISFHRHRKRAGLSSAEALRQAQLDMLDDPQHRYDQPYYWAPFILIGGYAAF